jgi:hypothetical protein
MIWGLLLKNQRINMNKPVKVGDIFEIPLSGGKKAFGHYVFEDLKKGPLIQVYDLIVNESEEVDVDALMRKPALFPPVITGLFAAIRTGMWKVIVNTPVKKFKYPGFVNTFWDEKTGKARIWFLWDGKKETKLGWELPDKYKKLEFLVGWSPHSVVERIETGIMPYPYKDLIENNEYDPNRNE